MPTDRTRPSDDRRQGYRGVRYQQGRVILDRDLNAGEEIAAEELRDVTRDVVGLVGSPDDGFRIGPPQGTTEFAFTIEAGTYYLGGVRVSLDKDTTYFTQPDWLDPDWVSKADEEKLMGDTWNEFVGLRVQEVEVTRREDEDLADVGLGGPGSADRLRLLVRVVRMRTKATDCRGAFDEATKQWEQDGFKFNQVTNELNPQGQLAVDFPPATSGTDLCQPETSGGYLHPDNQFIRVKRVRRGKENLLLWGFDNASFLYRVEGKPASATVKITPPPADATRFPKMGQFVEVLRAAVKLREGGYVAEPEGIVAKLTSGYDAETGTIVLDSTLPDNYKASPALFVRIWESTVSLPATKAPLVAVSDPSGPTGLTVTVPTGSGVGAYWTFAPRPSTPQEVYPKRYSTAQPPDGPRVWVAPLAFLKWDKEGKLDANSISDCREVFENLVELTKRKPGSGGGCCEVTITPDDVKAAGGLTGLFAKLRKDHRGTLHVCFRPGTYGLSEPLVLGNDFSRVVLVGCAGARWEASSTDAPDDFLDGMLVLAGCQNATIRGLRFAPPAVKLLPAFRARKVVDSALTILKRDYESSQSAVAIRAINASQLTVEACDFVFPTETPSAVFAAAVYANGDCTGLRMTRCRSNQPREAVRATDPNAGLRGALSLTNLKQLALAVHNFVDATAKPPQTLGDLLPYTDRSAKPFVHPGSGKTPPTGVPLDQLAAWVNANADYVYLPIEGKSQLLASRVLLHEKSIVGMTRLNLALGDGTAKSLDFDTARELIAASGGQLVGVPTVSSLRAWFALLACHQRFKTDEQDKVTYALRPVLDDVTLADNHFTGLSVPFLGAGDLGTITIRDNHATDCTGGIWLTSPERLALLPLFPETRFGAAVFDAFPLARVGDMSDVAARSLDFAICVVNNHLDARPTDPVTPAPAVCVFGDRALTLTTNADRATLPLISVKYRQLLRLTADRQTVVMTGNTVSGEPSLSGLVLAFTPALDATVLILEVDGATLTGNVIEDSRIAVAGAAPKSLLLWPRGSSPAPGDKVAVTGNVFHGATNLDSLPRSGTKPSWRDYNSEI